MSEPNAIIRIENLEKSFITKKNTVTALRDINLTIREGEIFGIIGMSGAGKSTLVRCINYLERPTKGKVFFNGLDMSKLSRRELETNPTVHRHDLSAVQPAHAAHHHWKHLLPAGDRWGSQGGGSQAGLWSFWSWWA